MMLSFIYHRDRANDEIFNVKLTTVTICIRGLYTSLLSYKVKSGNKYTKSNRFFFVAKLCHNEIENKLTKNFGQTIFG